MNAGGSAVILLPYKWTDVGTWNSVYDLMANGDGNYEDGNTVIINSHGSLVKGYNGKLVAVAGVRDLVVVDTEDALLVVSKSEMDKLKDIQKRLGETDRSQYL